MLLCADGRLDNKGVEGVRNQGNSKVGLLESLVQSSGIVHIEGNSLGVGETLAELLGTLKGSAGYKSHQHRAGLCRSITVKQMRCPGYIHPASSVQASCHWSGRDHERYIGNPQVRKDVYQQNLYVPTVTCTSALVRTSTVGLVTTSPSAKEVQVNAGFHVSGARSGVKEPYRSQSPEEGPWNQQFA